MLLLFVNAKVLSKKKKYFVILIALLVFPLVLLFLPATFFDNGQSLCPSKLLLNKDCPGCGITRGVMHAVHFDFKKAWYYNKLTFVVLPIIIYLWLSYLISYWKKRKTEN